MATKQQILDNINRYPDDHQFVNVFWSEEDVKGTAENMGQKLTVEQVAQVCDYLEDHHDAEYGINWENIRWAIQEIC